MKKLFLVFITLVLLAGLIFTSCAEEESTTTPPDTSQVTDKYGGTLKIIGRVPIRQLGSPVDGAEAGAMQSWYALPSLEHLLNMDIKGQLQPGLAETWDISPDGKTITLYLLEDVKFQDDTPFNAEAVKYNLEAMAETPYGQMNLACVDSYTIVDDYTIRLNLSEFNATILYHLSGWIGLMASPTAMAKPTTPENMAMDHMVGTGPFKLVDFKLNEYVKFEKWDGYREEGKPYLDGIEWNAITDAMTGLLAFKSGEAQVLNGASAQEAKDLEAAGYNISRNQIYFLFSVYPDSVSPDSIYADKKVRQAIEYAIDRQGIAEALNADYYEPLTQYASEVDAYYNPSLNRPYDVEKAKALLAEANHPDGFKTTIVTTSDLQMQTIATYIQGYLKEVGIEAELDVGDFGRVFGMMAQGWQDSLLVSPIPFSASLTTLKSYLSEGTSYASMLRPAGWQAKVDAAMAEPDYEKRIALHKEIIKMMFDESLGIPVYAQFEPQALDVSVMNFDYGTYYGIYWNTADTWLDTKE